MRLRAWSGYVALAGALTAGYFTVPTISPPLAHLSRLVLYNALGLTAVLATVYAIVRYRPRRPLPWACFAAGLAVYTTADIGLYVYTEVLHAAAPFAGWTDVLYCSAYLLLSSGMLLMIRSRTPGRDRASLIDSLTLAAGCASVSWVFLMAPFVRDPDLTPPQRLTALAYPLVGVLLLAMTARLTVGTGVRTPAYYLLLVSCLSLLIGDSYYVYTSLTVGFTTGTSADICWMIFYVGFGTAALHPSMRMLSEPTPLPPVTITTRRLFVLTAASLLAPAMLAFEWYWRGRVDAPVIAATSAVLFLLVIARMSGLIQLLRGQAEELDRMARVDALTEVPNRRAWDEALGAELERASRNGAAPHVALLDMDHFKQFNDAFGHLAGDRLLRESASRWRAQLRFCDTIARYGGEEFAVLLTECNTMESAVEILDRLRESTPLGQSFSAGVARWNGQEDPAALVARADEALYVAKRKGRRRTEPAPEPEPEPADTGEVLSA